jgi:hypothetical protein
MDGPILFYRSPPNRALQTTSDIERERARILRIRALQLRD